MLLYKGEYGTIIGTNNGCQLGYVCWCGRFQEYVTTHSCERFCEYYSSCDTTCWADDDLKKIRGIKGRETKWNLILNL